MRLHIQLGKRKANCDRDFVVDRLVEVQVSLESIHPDLSVKESTTTGILVLAFGLTLV